MFLRYSLIISDPTFMLLHVLPRCFGSFPTKNNSPARVWSVPSQWIGLAGLRHEYVRSPDIVSESDRIETLPFFVFVVISGGFLVFVFNSCYNVPSIELMG